MHEFYNLFVYLLLPYMFRAFFYLIFKGRCTILAVVQVSWVWCQRPGLSLTPYPRDLNHAEVVHLHLKMGLKKPDTFEAEVNRQIN
jgi:hypothetical protein